MKTQFNLISQFLKTISFESPNVPELFFLQGNGQAKLEINVDLQVKGTEEDLFMVDMLFAVHSRLEEDNKRVFSINCIYTGLVQMEAAEDEGAQKQTLLVDVPQLLFPAVRQLIEILTTESGFPPFRMQQVDFKKLYDSRGDNITSPCEEPKSGKKRKSSKFHKGQNNI